jgi:hypothetical protein
MSDTLGQHEWDVIRIARRKMFDHIASSAPPRTALQLGAVAVAGMFADLLTASTAAADIVDVINQQLAGAGYEVRKLPRN